MSLDFLDELLREEEGARAEIVLRNREYAMTLDEIAVIEGVSRQRVQEIINRAFRKMRRNAGPLLFRLREMYLHLEQARAERVAAE